MSTLKMGNFKGALTSARLTREHLLESAMQPFFILDTGTRQEYGVMQIAGHVISGSIARIFARAQTFCFKDL